MNYRHAFHAGNFADVFKHWIFCRILDYLKRKDAAFFCLDTHAGAGFYNLRGEAAGRTEEWRGGIGRILDAEPPETIAPLLEPYLGLVRAMQPKALYPGSPELAARLMRRMDFLSLTELHPDESAALQRQYKNNRRVKISAADGWKALAAELPPAQRRGIALIDPPFEKPDEFEQMFEAFLRAQKRWPQGCFALWYPVKDLRAHGRFINRAASSGIPKILELEISVAAPGGSGLAACGMLVVNPPWTLSGEADLVLPWLAQTMARDGYARAAVKLLTPESS